MAAGVGHKTLWGKILTFISSETTERFVKAKN
jgi:hypothetical protein